MDLLHIFCPYLKVKSIFPQSALFTRVVSHVYIIGIINYRNKASLHYLGLFLKHLR